MPHCFEYIRPTIKLYTRDNPDYKTGKTITRDTIPTVYKPNKLTAFVVHGYTQGFETPWLHEIKDKFLVKGDYNVVVIGWRRGSLDISYLQSSSNTRVVGMEIGLIAANLLAKGVNTRDNLYCIGHSLGSHVCGHAGMRTKFGRITALDPAGPWFVNPWDFQERDWHCGLNPSSADQVDAIHTNGWSLTNTNFGTLKPLGHVDFFPNGDSKQPGCIMDPTKRRRRRSLPIGTIDFQAACSHSRAIDLFTESINNDCFIARDRCRDSTILPGSCLEAATPLVMGFNDGNRYPKSSYGIYYLETNAVPPYCKN